MRPLNESRFVAISYPELLKVISLPNYDARIALLLMAEHARRGDNRIPLTIRRLAAILSASTRSINESLMRLTANRDENNFPVEPLVIKCSKSEYKLNLRCAENPIIESTSSLAEKGDLVCIPLTFFYGLNTAAGFIKPIAEWEKSIIDLYLICRMMIHECDYNYRRISDLRSETIRVGGINIPGLSYSWPTLKAAITALEKAGIVETSATQGGKAGMFRCTKPSVNAENFQTSNTNFQTSNTNSKASNTHVSSSSSLYDENTTTTSPEIRRFNNSGVIVPRNGKVTLMIGDKEHEVSVNKIIADICSLSNACSVSALTATLHRKARNGITTTYLDDRYLNVAPYIELVERRMEEERVQAVLDEIVNVLQCDGMAAILHGDNGLKITFSGIDGENFILSNGLTHSATAVRSLIKKHKNSWVEAISSLDEDLSMPPGTSSRIESCHVLDAVRSGKKLIVLDTVRRKSFTVTPTKDTVSAANQDKPILICRENDGSRLDLPMSQILNPPPNKPWLAKAFEFYLAEPEVSQ